MKNQKSKVTDQKNTQQQIKKESKEVKKISEQEWITNLRYRGMDVIEKVTYIQINSHDQLYIVSALDKYQHNNLWATEFCSWYYFYFTVIIFQ